MFERYQRQLILKDFGLSAQKKLQEAKVLVIGAGGLGCPALQYLGAAGVGMLGIADDDVVTLDNLHRQVLYRMEDIGKLKTNCAKSTLSALNPEITIITYNTRLTNQNALEIIPAYDVIIDGTDNFMSRYIINDACVLSGKPLVYGAISQYEGQLAVFNFGDHQNKPVNYRDLFPLPPGENQVFNCEEIGVLGVLPGIIGSMQANETIKILTGLGKPLVNQLLTYDALTSQSYSIEIFPNEEASVQLPKSENYFREFDYRLFCFPETGNVPEISVVQLKNMLENGDVTILDIRKNGQIREIEKSENFHHIPFEQLKEKYTAIKGKEVVVICQAGINSRKAVMELQDLFGSHKMFYSLRGGVIEWNRYLKNHPYDGKKT